MVSVQGKPEEKEISKRQTEELFGETLIHGLFCAAKYDASKLVLTQVSCPFPIQCHRKTFFRKICLCGPSNYHSAMEIF